MHADPLSRPAPSRSPRQLPVVLALVGAAALGVAYWWLGRETPIAPVVVTERPPAPEAVAPPSEPAIRHPIEQAQVDAARQTPLPELESSDAALLQRLAEMLAGTPFERVLVREGLVRKFVVTVDNIPRRTLALQMRPVQPAKGALTIEHANGGLTLGAANAGRYDDLMHVVERSDPRTLVSLYVGHYPLFQQAYRELGYPDGYFNDRLVVAIDTLLATPEIDGPIGLTQPRVLYEFADPGLEALAAGQKALLRMGPENAARVKARLREIRSLLVPKPPR